MRRIPTCNFRRQLAERRSDIRSFMRREDGSVIVLSLFLIPMMLILGGMAVDFMRYEGRRALIQDTADRAALAAANLEFTDTGDAVAVVDDYFEKAGLFRYLDGPAIVSGGGVLDRTVEVNVNQPVGTYFLTLIGIDRLQADAQSIATQGVGNVEISLVLDISGSMRNATTDELGNEITETGADGVTRTVTKIDALKVAATTFIDTALTDENRDRVSVSMVPYSTHVNVGSGIVNGLNVTGLHGYSHCIDFNDSDFSSTGVDGNTLEHAQHLDRFSTGTSVNFPSCPSETFQQVNALSQDRLALVTQIGQLEPYTNTSIFLGMKWGLALLDPSMRGVVPDVDPAFASRPSSFATATDSLPTTKVVVIMTDGRNTSTRRLRPEFYSTPSHIAHWAENPVEGWRSRNLFTSRHGLNDLTEEFYTNSEGNALLAASCEAARDANVQVFAIAFEAEADGEAAMADCATSPNHYFDTDGAGLNAVFLAIAQQVTDLRLTQ